MSEWIPGRNGVTEVLKSGRGITKLYVAEGKNEGSLKEILAKAKEQGKKSWDDAHLSPAERNAKMQEEREAQIAAAKARTAEANARYEEAKKK